MPRRGDRQRGILRPLIAILALAVIAAGVHFGYPYLNSFITGEFYINVKAEIDPQKDYRLRLWIERPFLPDLEPLRAGVEQALEEFATIFPRVAVELSYLSPGEAASKLDESLFAGTPPDVWFSAESSQSYFGTLQVPLSRYLDDEERSTWPAAVWLQVSTARQAYALPVALYPRVLLANAALLPASSSDLANPAQNGWSWDDFLSLAESARQDGVYGYVPSNILDELLQSIAASLGKPVPLADDGTPLWTEEDLQAMADVWRRLAASSAVPQPASTMDADCLDLFLRQKAAIIGPLNHHLAAWLWSQGNSPLLLPLPSGDGSLRHDARAVAISVFRQANYQGHDHTRAAAELAQFLVPRLSQLLQQLVNAVPAQTTVAVADLPYTGQSLQTYLNLERVVAAPYAYGERPGQSKLHWQTAVKPAWDSLVLGEISAEEFVQRVLNGIYAATITGP